MKIRPVGDELFHADGRTDMTKLIVAFRNFAKARINVSKFASSAFGKYVYTERGPTGPLFLHCLPWIPHTGP
jgi:hypothetical protein